MATLSSAASAVNSNLSTALIPYAAARRELRLTRYVCDKHIKAGRLRTVVAGRNLFIVAEDIANLGRELHAQELAQRHAGQFDSLSWVERCRIHRLPLPPALGRRRAHVLCVQHCYREVFALMGRRCPVEQAATVVLKVRLHRKAERCEQCARHGPVRESDAVGYLREGVHLGEITGNRSRTFCAPHVLDIMQQNAEDGVHGVIGDDIHGVIGGAVPRDWFAAESMMRLLEYCHVGEPHELCVECARAAELRPIGRGIASGAVRYELF